MSSSITTRMFGFAVTPATVRPFGCSPGGGNTTAGCPAGGETWCGRAAYTPARAARQATVTTPVTATVRLRVLTSRENTVNDNTAGPSSAADSPLSTA